MVRVLWSNVNQEANREPGIYRPKITAIVRRVTPMMVASTVFPFRNLNIHIPINKAIGMVEAMVNVPQELSDKALMTLDLVLPWQ